MEQLIYNSVLRQSSDEEQGSDSQSFSCSLQFLSKKQRKDLKRQSKLKKIQDRYQYKPQIDNFNNFGSVDYQNKLKWGTHKLNNTKRYQSQIQQSIKDESVGSIRNQDMYDDDQGEEKQIMMDKNHTDIRESSIIKFDQCDELVEGRIIIETFKQIKLCYGINFQCLKKDYQQMLQLIGRPISHNKLPKKKPKTDRQNRNSYKAQISCQNFQDSLKFYEVSTLLIKRLLMRNHKYQEPNHFISKYVKAKNEDITNDEDGQQFIETVFRDALKAYGKRKMLNLSQNGQIQAKQFIRVLLKCFYYVYNGQPYKMLEQFMRLHEDTKKNQQYFITIQLITYLIINKSIAGQDNIQKNHFFKTYFQKVEHKLVQSLRHRNKDQITKKVFTEIAKQWIQLYQPSWDNQAELNKIRCYLSHLQMQVKSGVYGSGYKHSKSTLKHICQAKYNQEQLFNA